MSQVQLDQGEWLSRKDHEALFMSECHIFEMTSLNLELLGSPAALLGKVLAAWKQFGSSNIVCHKQIICYIIYDSSFMNW